MQEHSADPQEIIFAARSKVRAALDDFHAYWYLGARFQYVPFLQYVHTPFKSATLNFNSMGFRGAEFAMRKPAGTKRVAFFGASALLGVPNATDEQTIPELCRGELARQGIQTDVLNFSVMCSMIKHHHDSLLRALLEFDPDVLVVYTGYNDVLRAYHGNIWKGYEDIETILNKGFEWNSHREVPTYHLRNAWAAVERKIEIWSRPRNSDAYEQLRQKRREAIIRQGEIMSAYLQGRTLFSVIAGQIALLARRYGKSLVFMHQPALSTTGKRKSLYERAYEQYMDLTFGPDAVQAERHRREFTKNYLLQQTESQEMMAGLGAHVYNPEPEIAGHGPEIDIFFDYASNLDGKSGGGQRACEIAARKQNP
jgi:hypothetical protein